MTLGARAFRAGALSFAVAMATDARAQATSTPAFPAAKLESLINGVVQKNAIPGLSVAVVLDQELRWSAAFGLADVENQVPAKVETVYRLASVAKPITATAVLQLVERGRLDLDAPIQRYVPSFPEKPWPVTARQLLCHQSGIRNWTEEEFRNTHRYLTVADGLAAFRDDALLFEPGTRTLYTSFGYNLLGAAIEGAAGQEFMEYLRVNVFEPAGMAATRLDDVLNVIPHRAHGYQRGPGGILLNSSPSDVSNRIPGGGLCAPVEDVARFALALQRGTLLKKETVALMMSRQKTREGKGTGYALGWVIGAPKGQREVYHLGGQPRVTTLLYLHPDKALAVTLLANLENVGPPILDLARQMAQALGR